MSSYKALYRKFRPQTFDHVIGQEHIVRTLKNQMVSERISHAYLFCGTRGTGKTSTAKIFAKAINCLSPENGEPCGKCSMCTAQNEGRSMNVVEIDAASNNGVDNIREIREEVKYPPAMGKYKVYIIDEVHMLSTGAFNALLKTLEEPPAHVIFILATTDPQKVPQTILSRCQRFDFKRIPARVISEALKKYLETEGVLADDDALLYIAGLADGSMRDSLSILDQCISFYFDEKITMDKVLEVTGSVDDSILFDATRLLAQKNAAALLELSDKIYLLGKDIKQFVSEFLEHLRNVLIAFSVPNPEELLEVSREKCEKYKALGSEITSDEVMYFLRAFSELSNELKYAENPRVILEITFLRLAAGSFKENVEGLYARLARLERELENGVRVPLKSNEANAEDVKKQAKKEKPKPKAVPEDIKELEKSWDEIVEAFPTVIKSLLSETKVSCMDGRCAALVCTNAAVENLIKAKSEEIKKGIEEKLGKSFELRTVSKDEYDSFCKLNSFEEGEPKEADPEFDSILNSYFPEADIDD